MTECISEFFEEIFFTESTIGKPVINGDSILIPIKGAFLLNGYPLDRLGLPVSGRMIFKGVTKSSHTIIEYIGDPTNPDGFKNPCVIVDVEDKGGNSKTRKYDFEGVLEDPRAWIDDWTIHAESFELELDDTQY